MSKSSVPHDLPEADKRSSSGKIELNSSVLAQGHAFQQKAFVAILVLGAFVSVLFGLFGSYQEIYITVIASITIAFIVAAMHDLKLGLSAGFLFLQPMFFYIGNSDFNESKLPFTIVLVSLIVGYWLIEKAIKGSGEFCLTKLFVPGLLVLISSLLSLVNATSFFLSFQDIIWIAYLGLFLLFLANTIKTPEQIRFLLAAMLTAASLASIFALLQYFGLLASAFPDKLNGTFAISSTFGNRNFLGGYISFLIPIGIALLFISENRRVRISLLLVSALLVTTLLAINSDSAWLAMILSSLVLLAGLFVTGEMRRLGEHKLLGVMFCCISILCSVALVIGTAIWVDLEDFPDPTLSEVVSTFTPLAFIGLGVLFLFPLAGILSSAFRSIQRRWVLIGTSGLFAIAALLLILTPFGGQVVEKINAIRSSESAVTRELFWWTALEMFKDQPLTGIGFGDYKREFLVYKGRVLSSENGQRFLENSPDEILTSHAHNDYLQIAAETGVVGILGFFLLLGLSLRSLVSNLRREKSLESLWLNVALASGAIAILGDSLFSFPLYLPVNGLAFVFILGALHASVWNDSKSSFKLRGLGLYLLTAILIAAICLASYFAVRSWQGDLHLQRGKISMLAGTSIAEIELQQSVQTDPFPDEAIYQLGKWYFQKGDLQLAQQLFEESVIIYPREDTYYFLAIIYSQRGQIELALEQLQTLESINPSEPLREELVPHLKAILLHLTGRSEHAITILETLIERDFKAEVVHLDLADIFIALNNSTKAEEHLLLSIGKIDEILLLNTDGDGETLPQWRVQELLQLKKGAEELLRLLP